MVKHSFLAHLFGGLLLFGCNSFHVDELRLSPGRSMETLPDGSLFGDVRYLSCSGNILSFFDFTQQRACLVDTSFSQGSTIGHKGRGPQELIQCDGMIVLQDTVIFTDFGSSSIKMFYNGETKSIRLENMRRFSQNRFAAYNDSLYFSFRSAENLIGAISLSDSTGHVRYFGQPFLKRNKVSTEVHNACNVFHYKDRILCVPQGLPLFYSVDKSSNTTTSYSLSRIKRYSANAKASKNRNGMKDNQVFVINQDACLAGDYLYILFSNISDGYRCNKILKLNIETRCSPVCIYSLPARVYNSFCVSDSYLFAYNAMSNKIVRFSI